MRRAVSTRALEKAAGTARPGPSAARKRLCQSSFFLGHRLLAEREGEASPDEEELEEFLFAVKGADACVAEPGTGRPEQREEVLLGVQLGSCRRAV